MTLDLRTGKAYPHRKEDYMTKISAVAADEDCPIPLWTAFLDTVTAGDKELQSYLQRVAGYCMTGVTTEHALFFLYGTGANGKSVFLNTLRGIWGSYAAVASMSTFIETRYEQHPTDLAMLAGVRLVITQEVEKGQAWAEAKINLMTGGDPITARYMRKDFFTYTPKFKLLIAGYHKPSLRSVNEAVRRRFHLVPFVVTIPPTRRDKDCPKSLKPNGRASSIGRCRAASNGRRPGWCRPPSCARPRRPISPRRTQSPTGSRPAAPSTRSIRRHRANCSARGANGPKTPASTPAATRPFPKASKSAASNASTPSTARCSWASRCGRTTRRRARPRPGGLIGDG